LYQKTRKIASAKCGFLLYLCGSALNILHEIYSVVAIFIGSSHESMEVTIHVVSMILVFVDKRQSIKIPIRNRNNCIRSDDMLY